MGDGQSLLPYPPPSGSHRRRRRALDYLGRKGRERATDPGGSCEKVTDHETCGAGGGGGPWSVQILTRAWPRDGRKLLREASVRGEGLRGDAEERLARGEKGGRLEKDL